MVSNPSAGTVADAAGGVADGRGRGHLRRRRGRRGCGLGLLDRSVRRCRCRRGLRFLLRRRSRRRGPSAGLLLVFILLAAHRGPCGVLRERPRRGPPCVNAEAFGHETVSRSLLVRRRKMCDFSRQRKNVKRIASARPRAPKRPTMRRDRDLSVEARHNTRAAAPIRAGRATAPARHHRSFEPPTSRLDPEARPGRRRRLRVVERRNKSWSRVPTTTRADDGRVAQAQAQSGGPPRDV